MSYIKVPQVVLDAMGLGSAQSDIPAFDLGRVIQASELNGLLTKRTDIQGNLCDGIEWQIIKTSRARASDGTTVSASNDETRTWVQAVRRFPSAPQLLQAFVENMSSKWNLYLNGRLLEVPSSRIFVGSNPIPGSTLDVYLTLKGDSLSGVTPSVFEQKVQNGQFITKDAMGVSVDGSYESPYKNYPGSWKLQAYISYGAQQIMADDNSTRITGGNAVKVRSYSLPGEGEFEGVAKTSVDSAARIQIISRSVQVPVVNALNVYKGESLLRLGAVVSPLADTWKLPATMYNSLDDTVQLERRYVTITDTEIEGVVG